MTNEERLKKIAECDAKIEALKKQLEHPTNPEIESLEKSIRELEILKASLPIVFLP